MSHHEIGIAFHFVTAALLCSLVVVYFELKLDGFCEKINRIRLFNSKFVDVVNFIKSYMNITESTVQMFRLSPREGRVLEM